MMVALAAGELDLAFVGPVPALTAASHGVPVRIVSGVASGGSSLVISRRSNAERLPDLCGKLVVAPQYGNTQEVQFRAIISDSGLPAGGPKALRLAQADPADCGVLLETGRVAAAFLPEPWASLYVSTGAGRRLSVPTATSENWLSYPSTVLAAREDFAANHPEILRRWASALAFVSGAIQARPEEALTVCRREIGRLTGKALPEEVMRQAFDSCRFSPAISQRSLQRYAEVCRSIGYIPRTYRPSDVLIETDTVKR